MNCFIRCYVYKKPYVSEYNWTYSFPPIFTYLNVGGLQEGSEKRFDSPGKF